MSVSTKIDVPDFKAALIEYSTSQFVCRAQVSSICIIIDSPSLHNPKCISKHRVLNLASNEQGEADYALWHHAIHYQGNDVLIVSSDTDVWMYGCMD